MFEPATYNYISSTEETFLKDFGANASELLEKTIRNISSLLIYLYMFI